MSIRIAFVSVAVLAVVGGAAVSEPPKGPVVLPGTPLIPAVNPPLPTPSVTVPAPPLPPPSVEQLLDALERVQAQKATLEKQEQELKATIRKKLDEQAERLKKLGIAPAAKDKEPDRVGRIIIEGNTKTPDSKILDKLELRPGQVLKYPALEESRRNLEKAGFRGVTVEALPNDLDETFKDIRVRVEEPKPKPAPEPVPTVRG